MKFSGRLQIEADPRNWLKTDLNLSQGRVELVSGDEILGSWSTAQVKAERVEGDRFELQLGDDRAVFAADDALAFSYEALPALAKKGVLTGATGIRGMLRKGLTGLERPAQADAHLADPRPAAVNRSSPGQSEHGDGADSDAGDDPLDLTDAPQPPRKLRDLIQAAARNGTPEPAALEDTWWEGDNGSPVTDDLEQAEDEHNHNSADPVWPAEPAWPADPVWPAARAWTADPVEAGVSSYAEAKSVTDLPEIGADEVERDQPSFDLSPAFADTDVVNETVEPVQPPSGMFDLPTTAFEEGETLGERPAEPFGWIRAAEEATPAVPDLDRAAPVIRSLDTLIDEVRNSGMSPAQIGAVTDLVRAVASALEHRNQR
jgi:hypothetical protein